MNITKNTTAHPMPKLKTRYPWRIMDIGDSFDVPTVDHSDPAHVRRQVLSAAQGAQRRTGWRFVIETKEGLVRVWRRA